MSFVWKILRKKGGRGGTPPYSLAGTTGRLI